MLETRNVKVMAEIIREFFLSDVPGCDVVVRRTPRPDRRKNPHVLGPPSNLNLLQTLNATRNECNDYRRGVWSTDDESCFLLFDRLVLRTLMVLSVSCLTASRSSGWDNCCLRILLSSCSTLAWVTTLS